MAEAPPVSDSDSVTDADREDIPETDVGGGGIDGSLEVNPDGRDGTDNRDGTEDRDPDDGNVSPGSTPPDEPRDSGGE